LIASKIIAVPSQEPTDRKFGVSFWPYSFFQAAMNALFAGRSRWFQVTAATASLGFQFDGWKEVSAGPVGSSPGRGLETEPLAGSCSAAFRRVERAPFIRLRGSSTGSTPLRTTIVPAGPT